MKYPKDKIGMNQHKVHNIYVDICPECHGVWFDHGELGKVTREFEFGNFAELFEKWKGELQKRERRVDFLEEDSYTCPKDYSVMKKHFYGGDTDVGIDNCKLCNGFWIDGGELTKIWEYNKPSQNKDILASGYYEVMTSADKAIAKVQKEMAQAVINISFLGANPAKWATFAFIALTKMMVSELLESEVQ